MENTQQSCTVQHQVFENIPLRTVESHWETLFNQLDGNGDGKIPYMYLSRQLAENNRGVPEYVVRRIVVMADKNNDGYITYPEFLRLVETPRTRPLFKNVLHNYVRHFVPKQLRLADSPDGAYEQEYTCMPPALAMIIFSLVQIFIFMYDKIKAGNTLSPNAQFFALFVYNPHRRAEIWRFFTYMFVHAGELHLVVNLCVQILLGIPLEMVHRWWRILIIYLAGVASGSLFTSVVDPTVFLAGASGGVYSLLFAHIATIIMNWTEMDHPALQLSIFLLLAITDTGNAVYTRYVANVKNRIAYAAHFAGAAAGFLVGIYVLRNLKVHPWERILWWISAMLFNALILTAILWNIFYPSYFVSQISFAKHIFND